MKTNNKNIKEIIFKKYVDTLNEYFDYKELYGVDHRYTIRAFASFCTMRDLILDTKLQDEFLKWKTTNYYLNEMG